MAKKKHQGHYCKICGEHKANEKFTGKGHAVHICKACQSLPADESSDTLLDKMIAEITGEMKTEGLELPSWSDSLTVMETERLIIRRFTSADLDMLCVIMGKPEVMHAWEHSFTRSDTRKWLNRQQTRYHKDGYGYFAVLLKENGTLIGQTGLLKSEINGAEVTEIGYIFDNTYWKQDYCTEAATACKRYAFEELGLDTLCCSIRPENLSSIRIAEKLGMVRTGEHIVVYREKEMPHLIYEVRNG